MIIVLYLPPDWHPFQEHFRRALLPPGRVGLPPVRLLSGRARGHALGPGQGELQIRNHNLVTRFKTHLHYLTIEKMTKNG